MRYNNLGGHLFANPYVAEKLRRFSSAEHSFETLFGLMFSESGNILYERREEDRIRKTTYGEAKEHILHRAAALKSLLAGIPHDSVVGLYMENSLAWIECFWAILCAGYRPLLMNLRLDGQTLETALHDAGAAAVITAGKKFPLLCVDPDALSGEERITGTEFGTELFVMSSGTSASVKLCAYSAEELYYQICDSYHIIRRCRLIKSRYRGELKHLVFLPFYHIFGLTAMYIWFAFFGRTFVHLDDLAPQTIVDTIRGHAVTHIFAVPLFWARVYDQAIRTIRTRGEETARRFDRALRLALRLSAIPPLGRLFSRLAFREVREKLFGESIRFMITGGSRIRTEILEFFNGIGYRLVNGYGMSETGICSVELSTRRSLLLGGSVGRPMASLEYRIAEDGELLVRGGAIARSVLEGGRKTRTDDWFRTRDLAECRNGHYFILGRKDDLVIGPAGENLNPELIEERLRSDELPQLALVKANGPTLLCELPQGMSSDERHAAELRLRDRLSELGLAGQIARIRWTAGPLVQNGDFKVNRRRLREDLLAGRLEMAEDPAVRPETAQDDRFLRELIDAVASALGTDPTEIGVSSDFFLDLGGTSLDYFALMAALQEKYGIDFPSEGGSGISTVEGLYEYLRSVGVYGDQAL